ncbi:MAG TPA: hypothetical protein VH136_01010 [Trebonia sp.]|nr:hypothetical protein [Trebonia sp.]
MLVLRHRLAIAGVITATAIAVPAAALASGPGAPSGKPAPPQASAASASKSAAASSGAPSGKPAPPKSPAAGSGQAPSQLKKQAQADLPPAPVRAFAARLGVSISAAERPFKEIAGLSVKNGVDPASPAVAAIARELGVSPAQLVAAWNAVK